MEAEKEGVGAQEEGEILVEVLEDASQFKHLGIYFKEKEVLQYDVKKEAGERLETIVAVKK